MKAFLDRAAGGATAEFGPVTALNLNSNISYVCYESQKIPLSGGSIKTPQSILS